MTTAPDLVGPLPRAAHAPAGASADAASAGNAEGAPNGDDTPFDVEMLLATLPQPIVFVDLETTGSDPLTDRITEIGVVEIHRGGVDEWSVMFDPERPIPPFIQQLTGIDDEMVKGQPTFASLAPQLAERLEGRLFVAHNARFDYGFLKNAFRRVGIRFRADMLCTVRLSRALFPSVRKHGLDALIERFQLSPRGRHRALADADLIWQFWQKIHQRYTPELVDAAIESLVRRASLPAGLDEDALEAIPAMPGVYIFYGDNDLPLYVGKSVDLKQRVTAHFSSDHRIAKELRLSREIKRVECRQTAGEIGALLLEAQLIKTLTPTHNRLLRRRGTPCSWHFPDDASVPKLTSPHERDFGRSDGLYGIFDSAAKAESRMRKLADTDRLCLACLGIEKRQHGAPCFAYQTKRCDGACVGKESLAAHARRVRAALAPLRIDRWPYDGAIAFAERHRTGLTQWHVVDNWCYIGTSEDPRALHGIAASAPMPLLDRDTYTILRRAFKDPTLDVLPLRVERSLSLSAPIVPGAPNEAAAETADGAAGKRTVPAPHTSAKIGQPAGQLAARPADRMADAGAPRRRPLARKSAPVGQLTLDLTFIA